MSLSFQSLLIKCTFALMFLLGFFVSYQTAYAIPYITINGSTEANVVIGQPITVYWYIDDPTVTSCSINNGIGEIDVSTIPTWGSTTTILFEDGDISYVLTCVGGVVIPPVEVNTNSPTVSMWTSQGTEQTVNPLTGRVNNMDIHWDSENADRCSLMYKELDSNPGVLTQMNSGDYSNAWRTYGYVRIDGSPYLITETTTFYVSCYNDAINEAATSSLTINVSNPEPPPAPTVNIWASPETAVQDLMSGYAYSDVGFSSDNVTWCEEKAYYEDGTEYSPHGWGWNRWTLNRTGYVEMSATTIFEVTCGRGDVVIGGVLYPAASDTQSIRVEVLPPAGVVDVDSWDRTTLPPVIVSVEADPLSPFKDNITYRARTYASYTSQNADDCRLRAYRTNGTPTDYSDDSEYNLSGWTGWRGGNTTWGNYIYLSEDTRLQVYCMRWYDIEFGDAAEVDNGTETVNVVVELQEPATMAANPVTYMYGNAVVIYGRDMWYGATAPIVGFNYTASNGNARTLSNETSGATTNSITFRFSHPFEAGDNYDVILGYCDENDGVSTFNLKVNGVPVGNTIVSNRTDSASSGCDWSSYHTDMFARGVTINHGDHITIECSTPDDGERCRLRSIYLGAGNGASVETATVITGEYIDVPLMWWSENTSYCDAGRATNDDGEYWWNWNSDTHKMMTQSINTSTSFKVTCYRGDGASDTSEVKVLVPYTSGVMSFSAAAAAGECFNPVTGEMEETQEGYWANPENGWNCEPAVDLEAESQRLTLPEDNPDPYANDNVNNIYGTYDNLRIDISILNVGTGTLPVGSSISYQTKMTPTLGPSSAILTSPDGDYDGTLTRNDSEWVNRTFNGVMFGTYQVCSRVNLDFNDELIFPEANPVVDLNHRCQSEVIPVPKPPMGIWADKEFVRKDEIANINWFAETAYPMTCEVYGAGDISATFEANEMYITPPAHGGQAVGSQATSPLTSTSEFVLKCTEPTTGTSFIETTRVEMVPDFEEI